MIGIEMGRWLKKYMKIKHLERTLVEKKLHLGNPQCWPDENDSEVIEIYKRKNNLIDIRATCLTMAPDRNHFWELFGERELGVCLWFNRVKLLKDIERDTGLRGKVITYYTPEKLIEECGLSDLPFAKREQYSDEQEYRVLRECKFPANEEDRGIAFSPRSLEKVYFNCWLNPSAYQMTKRNVQNLVPQSYGHVAIKQNRTLRFSKWIDAADKVG